MTKKYVYSEKVIKAYDAILEPFVGIKRKGKNSPYTSHNGHMFSFLDKDENFSLRFSKEDLKNFMDEYNAKPSIQHGRVMNGYAIVPKDLFYNTNEMHKLFKMSLEFISGLKPKPSKRKTNK